MAFALFIEPPSMTAAQYDDIMRGLDAAGAGAPAGRLYHACFGTGDQLRILDVWESQESLDAFVGTLLSLPGDWEGLDPGEPELAALYRVAVAPAAAAV